MRWLNDRGSKLNPTWEKNRADSHRLCSDLHTCAIPYPRLHMHTHTRQTDIFTQTDGQTHIHQTDTLHIYPCTKTQTDGQTHIHKYTRNTDQTDRHTTHISIHTDIDRWTDTHTYTQIERHTYTYTHAHRHRQTMDIYTYIYTNRDQTDTYTQTGRHRDTHIDAQTDC